MSDSYPIDPEAACVACARDLGPLSTQLIDEPEVRAGVVERLLNGVEVQDAVLRVVHERFRGGGPVGLWSEMLEYVYRDLRKASSNAVRRRNKGALETIEVLNSMFVAIQDGVGEFEYKSYPEFVAFLAQRFRWRWDSHHRKQRSETEHLAKGHGPDLLEQNGTAAEVLSQIEQLSQKELFARLEEVLEEVPAEDRALFEAWLEDRKGFAGVARSSGVNRSVVKRKIDAILRRLGPPKRE